MEEIIDYVVETPQNTNPNISRGMLSKLGGSGMKVIPFPWDDNTQYIEAAEVDALITDLPDAFEYEITTSNEKILMRVLYEYKSVGLSSGNLVYLFQPIRNPTKDKEFTIVISPNSFISYGMAGSSKTLGYNSTTARYEAYG